jgi:acyl carrier protein
MSKKTERINELANAYASAVFDMFMTSLDENMLNEINEETDFIKDLKINSANLVDIILDVEEEFNIEIDNASMEKMLTVKASIEVILSKITKE